MHHILIILTNLHLLRPLRRVVPVSCVDCSTGSGIATSFFEARVVRLPLTKGGSAAKFASLSSWSSPPVDCSRVLCRLPRPALFCFPFFGSVCTSLSSFATARSSIVGPYSEYGKVNSVNGSSVNVSVGGASPDTGDRGKASSLSSSVLRS